MIRFFTLEGDEVWINPRCVLLIEPVETVAGQDLARIEYGSSETRSVTVKGSAYRTAERMSDS